MRLLPQNLNVAPQRVAEVTTARKGVKNETCLSQEVYMRFNSSARILKSRVRQIGQILQPQKIEKQKIANDVFRENKRLFYFFVKRLQLLSRIKNQNPLNKSTNRRGIENFASLLTDKE